MQLRLHRSGGAISVVLAFSLGAAAQVKITARQLVAEIQKQVGVEWQKDTVDTFKAGNPDSVVTGVALTMMATMDVLQRASAKGLNLVITHEPTFYAHLDTPEGIPESDPVWTEKRAFIEKHGLVVWRFHDHWHRRNPDGIEAGKRTIEFPLPMSMLMRLVRVMPAPLYDRVLRPYAKRKIDPSKVRR